MIEKFTYCPFCNQKMMSYSIVDIITKYCICNNSLFVSLILDKICSYSFDYCINDKRYYVFCDKVYKNTESTALFNSANYDPPIIEVNYFYVPNNEKQFYHNLVEKLLTMVAFQ